MALVETMTRLEYCHEVLCKCFLIASHYQDVNVLYVQVSLKLYVKRKRVDVQSMSSGSTIWSCIYVIQCVFRYFRLECRLSLMAY